jgi:hypothetical protein
MERKELLQVKYCPHCGAIYGAGQEPSGWQGDWCCGARDVTWAPAHALLGWGGRPAQELKRVRRRLEDRLRKDPEFLSKVMELAGFIA